MAEISSPRNSSSWSTDDEEILQLQAKLKEHAKAKVRNSVDDDTNKSLTKRVFRKKKSNTLTDSSLPSSPASNSPTPKVRVEVSVHVDDYEKLQCKSDFNMKLILRDITISELLHKIGKQAELDLIKTNTLYGEANFNLIHVGQATGTETKLDSKSKLATLIHNKDRLILRKKKHEQIAVSVIVEDYEELGSANRVGFLFFKDLLVKETLHKICRKASINIPLDEEDNFEIQNSDHEVLDDTKTLEQQNITNRSTIHLKRKVKEENVTLSICIEDYRDLKCEKKIKSTFNRNTSVTELLDKLVEKSKSATLKSDIHKYDLVIVHNGEKMWRGKIIRDFLLNNSDILILRRKSAAEILMESTGVIRHKDIELTEKIGGGTFGKVYKGYFMGMAIAVKVLRETPESKEAEFRREVELLRNLRHPHVVNFFGTIEEENKLCIVMELCGKGSLYHVMNNDVYEIGWDRALKCCLEASEGLHFLHTLTPSIIHRDLKSLNLLVTDSWQTKLCDFGLSRPQLSDFNSTLKKMRSTPAWCAPELMREKPYSIASDIYAMGMVFWEIVVRCIRGRYERPYGEYKDIQMEYQIILQASSNKLRPTIPASTPPKMAELITSCLLDEPSERPDTARLVASLREMRDDYAKNPKPWDQSIVLEE